MVKSSGGQKKSEMILNEIGDKQIAREQLLQAGKILVATGFKEYRQETDEEKASRVDHSLASTRLEGAALEQRRSEFMSEENLVREFEVFRKESDEEMSERIEFEVSQIEELTSEQIQSKRNEYEDA